MHSLLLALVLAAVGQQQDGVNPNYIEFVTPSAVPHTLLIHYDISADLIMCNSDGRDEPCVDRQLRMMLKVDPPHLGSRTPVTLETRVDPPGASWGYDVLICPVQGLKDHCIGQEIDMNIEKPRP